MYVDALPRWERYTYWICTLASIAYSIYNVFQEGERNKDKYQGRDLISGWSWIGRQKDKSQRGWFIYCHFWRTVLPWSSIPIMLSQTCWYFQLNGRIRLLLLTITNLCLVSLVFGTRAVIFLLAMATVMYVISRQGRILLIWLPSLAMMFSWIFFDTDVLRAEYLLIRETRLAIQFRISSALFWTKIISFGLEKRKYRQHTASTKTTDSQISGDTSVSRNTSSAQPTQPSSRSSNSETKATIPTSEYVHKGIVGSDPSYLDFLFYLFYFPTFFIGPLYDYCHFHNNVKASFKSFIITENVYDITKQLVKITLFIFFAELHFHFLYYACLGRNHVFLEETSDWALWGILYCQGCFFVVKYCIAFGFGIQLSRFDGIAPLPTPRCISVTRSGTDFWTTFDVGLYTFFKKYIFIPLGGSKRGILRQLLSSGLCFLFTMFWHGTRSHIVKWCVVSYFMCVLEAVVGNLDKSEIGVKIKSHLSPAMILRLKALLYYLAYTMVMVTNYYFFFGDEAGWVAFSRLTFKSTWLSHAVLCFVITCNLHTAIYLRELSSHRDKKAC